MASVPIGRHISVDEYLRTDYHPDCDYTDGLVEERNWGEQEHSSIQTNLAVFFGSRGRALGLRVWVEWRFQIAATCFRVPDVTLTRGKPDEKILTSAPLLIVEVLSAEDRRARVRNRIQEYLDFGVPAVWLIDPDDRSIEIYRLSGMERATDPVAVDGINLEVPFTEIFE